MNLMLSRAGLAISCLFLFACGKSGGSGEPDPPPPPSDGEIVFCTDFEEGNLDMWDDWDGNPPPGNLVLADPGPHNKEGNHVMRFRVAPGRGSADLVKVLPKKYDKLYARWYVYWEPGYDFDARNHGGGLFAGERSFLGQSDNRPDGSNFATSWFEVNPRVHRPFLYTYYRGMYQDCANPNGGCWGDGFPCLADDGQTFCTNAGHRPTSAKTPPVLTTGKWYRVEIMMDMGNAVTNAAGATGVLNMWIDGVEYGPWEKLWFRNTNDLQLSILWMQLFHHEDHSEEGMLIDDIIVSDAPIGTATACE